MDAFAFPTTSGTRAGLRHHLLAVMFAVAGGVLGVAGAFVEELQAGGFVLLVLVGAPIIEELLKPVGIYIYLSRWPSVLQPQVYTATLVALSGLSFGLIESTIYVMLYVPDHPAWFFAYRYTVPVSLHTLTSFIAGTGVNSRLVGWAGGRNPFPKASRNAFLAAMAIHGLYNATALGLGLAGVFDFD